MKSSQIALAVFLVFLLMVAPCSATTDCDLAQVVFSNGIMGPERLRLGRYLKAIDLCPGFIRPYELVGNIYRNKGQRDKSLEYFNIAVELGSLNYKMYYLMAALLSESHRPVSRFYPAV